MAPYKVVIALIVGSILWASQGTTARQQPTGPNQIPIAFEDPRIVPADVERQRPAQFSITLRNTGTKTIVGWGITVEIRHVNGRISRRQRMTDAIEMIDLDWRRVPILPPNGRYTFTDFDAPGVDLSPPVDVAGTATYVIFSDDTALGDEKLIGDRFDKRALTLSVWLQAEQALEGGLRAGGSPEQILQTADRLMEGVVDPAIRSSVTFAAARRLLTQDAARAPATSATILEALRQDIPKRRQALQAHLVRRK